MLVRYSYSRSTLLVIVSRYVLAVAKAPWYSVSVLCHAGTVLVYVAGIGYLVITGYRRALGQSQSTRLPITYVPLHQAYTYRIPHLLQLVINIKSPLGI